MLKNKIDNDDEATWVAGINKELHVLAGKFRQDDKPDLKYLYEQIDNAIEMSVTYPARDGEPDDIVDIMMELSSFLKGLYKTRSRTGMIKVIKAHIITIDWDNWKDDKDLDERNFYKSHGDADAGEDDYYSLGSVWYNKMQYVTENTSSPFLKEVSGLMAAHCNKYFDMLEVLTQ